MSLDELKEKHKEELEVYLKERKKKSNDERWTYLETQIFWILKGLEQTNTSLKMLGSLNKEGIGTWEEAPTDVYIPSE